MEEEEKRKKKKKQKKQNLNENKPNADETPLQILLTVKFQIKN